MSSRIATDAGRLGAARPALLVGLVLLAAPACGHSGPEMARVNGTVKYEGKPLTKGNISFQPVDAANGAIATGKIGPDGSYELHTEEPGDGARLGDYRVTIDDQGREDILDYIPKKKVARKSQFPAKYHDPKSSDLKATVKPGRNDIPFDLP